MLGDLGREPGGIWEGPEARGDRGQGHPWVHKGPAPVVTVLPGLALGTPLLS